MQLTINNPISDNCLLYSSSSELKRIFSLSEPSYRSIETSGSCNLVDTVDTSIKKLLDEEERLLDRMQDLERQMKKLTKELNSLQCNRRSIFASDCSGDEPVELLPRVRVWQTTFNGKIMVLGGSWSPEVCGGEHLIFRQRQEQQLCQGELDLEEVVCQGVIDFYHPEVKFFDNLRFHGDIILNIEENSHGMRAGDLRLPIFSSNDKELFLCMTEWEHDGSGYTLREELESNSEAWPLTYGKITKDKSFNSIVREGEPTHILFISEYENTDLSNFERPFFDESGAARYYLVPIHLVTSEFLEDFKYKTCSDVFVCWVKDISDIEESHPLAKNNCDLSFEPRKTSYRYESSNA